MRADVRLPLVEASEAARAQVKKAMQGAGLIKLMSDFPAADQVKSGPDTQATSDLRSPAVTGDVTRCST